MAEQDAVTALQTIIGLSEGGAKSAVEQLRQRGFTLTPLQPVQQEPVGKWEFIARLVCSSFGNNPDKHWQSYNTPAMRMAVNAYRDYLAAQGLRVVLGRQPVETAPKEGWFIIEYADGRLAPGHWLDNSKSQWPFAGIRPASMFAEKPNDKIVGWHPLPTTEPGSK